MKSLGPIDFPDAYLSSVHAKVSYWALLTASGSVYVAGLAVSKASIPLLSLSLGLNWFAHRSAIQATRKGSFINRWVAVASDRFEDNLFQKMETNTPVTIPSEIVEQKRINLPKLLSENLKSTLILGAPRAGKGYAVAKDIELKCGSVEIWLIDPKNDPSEAHYWASIPEARRLHFDAITEQVPIIMSKVSTFVQQFLESPSSREAPKLLIIDEASPGLSTCDKKWFSKLMLKCARLASIGPSKGAFVYILSQSGTGEDLGISQANRGGYRIVAVANADTPTAWFDSINRSLGLGAKPKELLESNYYVQNDGNGWAAADPIALVQATVHEPGMNHLEPQAEPAEPFEFKGLTDLPAFMDKDDLRAIVGLMVSGSSMSSSIKTQGYSGPKFTATADFLKEHYPELFNDNKGGVKSDLGLLESEG